MKEKSTLKNSWTARALGIVALDAPCTRRTTRLATVSLLAALAGMLMNTSVEASPFGVRVVDASGAPVAGASVCIGLPGNYQQFGALFTDTDGKAVVDVPNIPLVVTISKTRFSGLRINEPARGFNLIRQVTLSDGVPGPRCRAGSTMAETSGSVRVEDVDVDESASTITLKPRATGNPSHYRISSDIAFADADWQRYDDSIRLSQSLSGRSEVYLQLRRLEGSSRASLEARSAVVTVNLPTVR